MENVKKILAVSRSTLQCNRVVRAGISMAKKYSSRLFVMQVVHDPFHATGWNLPIPALDAEFEASMKRAAKEMHDIIAEEKAHGFKIEELVRDGNPADAIQKTVDEEGIDLLLMLGHEEGRLEHYLFGRTNDEIYRRMPCSIFLMKSGPGA